MTALATFPKLRKLIPLLGSDQSGEVVAAACAIGRALKGSGLDWHDLVDVIEHGGAQRCVRRAEPEWPLPADLQMAIWCRDTESGRLKPREREVVVDIIRSLRLTGKPLTDRQMRWLRAIAAMLGRSS